MQIIGIAAALTLACSSTAKDSVSKHLSSKLTGTISTFASFLFAIPFYLVILPILYLLGLETFAVSPLFYRYIALRALSDTGAEWSKMESISRADISLVAAFQSLSPAFLVIFSPLITGDSISSGCVFGLLIIAIAGVLMANPFQAGGKSQLPGILFGILSAFFFSINHCFDRLAAQTSSSSLAAFAVTLMACFFFIPFIMRHAFKHGGQPTIFTTLRSESKGLWLRGFFEVISLTAKLTALQYLTAPSVVAIGRLSVPLSILSGAILFKEKQLGRRLIFGSVMVLGCLMALLN